MTGIKNKRIFFLLQTKVPGGKDENPTGNLGQVLSPIKTNAPPNIGDVVNSPKLSSTNGSPKNVNIPPHSFVSNPPTPPQHYSERGINFSPFPTQPSFNQAPYYHSGLNFNHQTPFYPQSQYNSGFHYNNQAGHFNPTFPNQQGYPSSYGNGFHQGFTPNNGYGATYGHQNFVPNGRYGSNNGHPGYVPNSHYGFNNGHGHNPYVSNLPPTNPYYGVHNKVRRAKKLVDTADYLLQRGMNPFRRTRPSNAHYGGYY